MLSKKEQLRKRRHIKIRKKIIGTSSKPRLVIFRSLKNNYAQIIDDEKGLTLINASDIKNKSKDNKTKKAHDLGLEIAKKAKEQKIEIVSFDRNGYKYHGRVKAIAEGAREGGLQF